MNRLKQYREEILHILGNTLEIKRLELRAKVKEKYQDDFDTGRFSLALVTLIKAEKVKAIFALHPDNARFYLPAHGPDLQWNYTKELLQKELIYLSENRKLIFDTLDEMDDHIKDCQHLIRTHNEEPPEWA